MSKRETPLKLGVLVSGSGTNLQSIIDNCKSGEINAQVSVVVSDTPGVKALERAQNHNIQAKCIERKSFGSKKEYEGAILDALNEAGVELVCLAGYMRIVGPTLLGAFNGRMINIHPALLPSFPGLEGQKQAWDYGVKIAGCTVHFVDELADHGPIIIQAAVDVKEDDTVETLKGRILKEEHRIYPQAIQLIAEDRIRVEGRRVYIST
jgi:phosphoribosylglycinamide formyltransferase-1